MKIFPIVCVLFGGLLTLASCRSKASISRDQAAGLIKAKLNLPEIETISLKKEYFKGSRADDEGSSMPTLCIDSVGEDGLASEKPALEALRAKDVISFGKDSAKRKRKCVYLYATVSLTDEGRKHLVRETSEAYILKAYELNFGEVTGVQVNEQLKQAQVDFTLVVSQITPFARGIPGSPMGRQASFSLYDDGWRMQN